MMSTPKYWVLVGVYIARRAEVTRRRVAVLYSSTNVVDDKWRTNASSCLRVWQVDRIEFVGSGCEGKSRELN